MRVAATPYLALAAHVICVYDVKDAHVPNNMTTDHACHLSTSLNHGLESRVRHVHSVRITHTRLQDNHHESWFAPSQPKSATWTHVIRGASTAVPAVARSNKPPVLVESLEVSETVVTDCESAHWFVFALDDREHTVL
jgi:hypothetical protein